MGNFGQWLEILASVKAIAESIRTGLSLAETYAKYRHDPDVVREAERVSQDDSTFSPAEVSAIQARLEGCRTRFIEQGGGADRSRCVCGVLREAKEGNGGSLPRIDDWERYYAQLDCGRFESP
jgi:hypothetical protein